MEELKPCPFCGFKPGKPVQLGIHANKDWQIYCGHCDFIFRKNDLDELIAVWNNRVENRNE